LQANSTLANDWIGCLVEFNSFIFLPLSDANLDQKRLATAFSVPVAVTAIPTATSAGHHLSTSRGQARKPGRRLHPDRHQIESEIQIAKRIRLGRSIQSCVGNIMNADLILS
jgi:hypothetical protein